MQEYSAASSLRPGWSEDPESARQYPHGMSGTVSTDAQEQPRRFMIMLPPGGTLSTGAGEDRLAIPLWLYWLQSAEAHAEEGATSPVTYLIARIGSAWFPSVAVRLGG